MEDDKGKIFLQPTPRQNVVRDTKLHVEHFFHKKFGYKWKKRMKAGEITKEELDLCQEDYKKMLNNLRGQP